MDAQPEVDEGKVTLVEAHWDGDTLKEGKEPKGNQEHWAWGARRPGRRGASGWGPWGGGGAPRRGAAVWGRGGWDQSHQLYAKPGQKIAFVGSTGAGKTTITNLINRFYEIQSGSITYDGIDVKDIAKDSLRRSLGAVLQDTHLFTGTVMDNIRYGRLDATDEGVHRRRQDRQRRQLHPPAAQRLSDHGHRRRGQSVPGPAAAAGHRPGGRGGPPVMILDEATSSIDTRTEALISKGHGHPDGGPTVFVIAHRLSRPPGRMPKPFGQGQSGI